MWTASTLIPFLSVLLILIEGCESKPSRTWSSADSLRIVQEVLAHRAAADSFFRNDAASPFRRDSTISYTGIKWFPPNVDLCARSKLYTYSDPETVNVVGTKGDERKHLRHGYFILDLSGKEVKLNAYRFIPSDPKSYVLYKNVLSVLFTDRTTGKETYEVGRYVDVGSESSDPGFVYTIDFNKAYNPYCAYSPLYSCAIPRKEDFLDVEIRAGEMKYSHH